MDRLKITAALIICILMSGCVYESNFTCEGFKNAGRACKPASTNIEYAISGKGETEPQQSDLKQPSQDFPELYIKCGENENCSFKPASQEYLYLKQDAKDYLEYKQNENSIKADELTSYNIKVNAETNTPVTSKPKTLKVTILPYVDEKGRLNLIKRVYLILQKPEWILGDYLLIDDKNIKLKD